MDKKFHKFPSTPHLAWLSSKPLRGDKVMTMTEAREFLSSQLIVEEKIDGANLGISLNESQEVRLQNRGNWLLEPFKGQWKPLRSWLQKHDGHFRRHLEPNLIIFGEWCYARHSIFYTSLPDYFIGFDVYDAKHSAFWSRSRRNELLNKVEIVSVPLVRDGQNNLQSLIGMLSEPSCFSESPREGLYLRREENGLLLSRAKLVNPNFAQVIDSHWSRSALQSNKLSPTRHY